MDKDRVKGQRPIWAARSKKGAGDLTGDKKLKSEGVARSGEGQGSERRRRHQGRDQRKELSSGLEGKGLPRPFPSLAAAVPLTAKPRPGTAPPTAVVAPVLKERRIQSPSSPLNERDEEERKPPKEKPDHTLAENSDENLDGKLDLKSLPDQRPDISEDHQVALAFTGRAAAIGDRSALLVVWAGGGGRRGRSVVSSPNI